MPEGDEKIKENLYFGSKGLSLNNKLVFFNQDLNGHKAGDMKIGPWFVQNTSFWKGSNKLGGNYTQFLSGEIKDSDLFIIPEEVENPGEAPSAPSKPENSRPTQILPEPDEEASEEEIEAYENQQELITAWEEYDKALNEYNTLKSQWDSDKITYDQYLTDLQKYNSALKDKLAEWNGDIYLGNDGFSLGSSFIYHKSNGQLEINGNLLCKNSSNPDQQKLINLELREVIKEKKPNGEEVQKETDKVLKSLSFSPNQIRFDNPNNSDTYKAGYIHYTPGKAYGTDTGASNGNYFYFSQPINTPNLRFTNANICLLTTGVADNNLAFYVGPNLTDSRATRYAVANRPRRTYLRGARLILDAYGATADTSIKKDYRDWSGEIYARCRRFILYNRGSKKPYTNKSWTTSSDERVKNLKPLDERYYDFFSKLNPLAYTWKEDGENGRVNIGYSAQQVKQALFDSGLGLNDFAGLTIDYDNEEAKKQGIEDFHTLTYEEFGPIYAAVLQRALKKIDELEERIKELEQ